MICSTSPTKSSGRRTKAEIAKIREAIYTILEAENPASCRQIFYRLVSSGVIRKTESEYKQTVCRLLARMRRDDEIRYDWISDATRWQRKPSTSHGLSEALERTANFYRRDLWENQDVYVEVWSEKEALAGVLWESTAPWQVPLMVCKGYPSLSYLFEAGNTIRNIGKPAHIYYLGDHDPSGVDIPRFVEKEIRGFAPDAEFTFERIAVTEDQIDEYDLQTRPTKKTDTRARNFEGESVEVDAIPPVELRKFVSEVIEQHIDNHALDQIRRIEKAEKDTLKKVLRVHSSGRLDHLLTTFDTFYNSPDNDDDGGDEEE